MPSGCAAPATPSSTVAGASYQQPFSYDPLDRLTFGPLGGYTYGAGLQASSGTNGTKAPLHAALSIGTGSTPSWTAGYDTAGDMTCRTAPSVPSSGATCTSVFSAQAPVQRLLDDSEGRLVGWQVSASGATTSLLYDGAGNRVEQVVPPGCSLDCFTSTTVYQGGVQEQFRSGQITRLTKYEPTGVSGVTALSSSTGTYSYLASDGLGSVSAALSSSGSVTATQLYAPYGTVRYASGAMPGTLGYTGQHDDGPGGLLYYGARYYDPVAGQFTSADTLLAGGLNRYGYVGDNPETATDPTGHAYDHTDRNGESVAQEEAGLYQIAMSGGTDENGIPIAASMYAYNYGNAWGLADSYSENVLHSTGLWFETGREASIYEHAHTSAYWNSSSDTMAQFEAISHMAGMYAAAVTGPKSGFNLSEAALQPSYTDASANLSGRIGETVQGDTPDGGAGATSDDNISGEPPAINSGDIVYRGLAKGEDPAGGLTARSPESTGVDPVSHIAGKRASPWISTTRSVQVATEKFGENGVVAIDLARVSTSIVDFSNGIPGRAGQMISNWAARDQEVLIFQHVPPDAIIWRR